MNHQREVEVLHTLQVQTAAQEVEDDLQELAVTETKVVIHHLKEMQAEERLTKAELAAAEAAADKAETADHHLADQAELEHLLQWAEQTYHTQAEAAEESVTLDLEDQAALAAAEAAAKDKVHQELLTPVAVEAEADTVRDLTHKITVKAETVDQEL